MASLAEIRAKLKAIEEKKGGNKQSFSKSLVYPFWNIDENSSVALRFLPDKDEENTFFWRERQLINLKFPGVKGHDETKEVTIKVPCVEMWGDTCPVHTELRPWFKDTSMEDLAKQYWKKRTYLFQGFVNDNPIVEDAADAPENPIRRFNLGPQIFNIVKDALLDPDMECNPVDYVNGIDFRVTRTKKGTYNDYSTSKWSRKETGLSEEQLEAITTNGLFDLNDWMPRRPTPEGLNAIFEMFEASVAGELYDPEQWGKFYRPWGLEIEGDKTTEEATPAVAPTPTTAPTPVPEAVTTIVDAAPAPVVEVVVEAAPAAAVEPVAIVAPVVANPQTSAQAILDKIRARASD